MDLSFKVEYGLGEVEKIVTLRNRNRIRYDFSHERSATAFSDLECVEPHGKPQRDVGVSVPRLAKGRNGTKPVY